MELLQQNPYSFIMYMSILVLSCFFSYLAQQLKKNQVSRLFLVLLILVLSIPLGFRHFSVGNDTLGYMRAIESAKTLYVGELFYKYYDYGFQAVIKILIFLFSETQYVLLAIAIITNFFIIRSLWIFSDRFSFVVSVFCYVTMYYFQTYNIMRQWLAVAIVFFAFIYLFKEKYVKFILILVSASSIHMSAIVCFSFLPLYILIVKKASFRYKFFAFLSTCLLFLGLQFISRKLGLSTGIDEKFQYYIQDVGFEGVDFGVYFILRVAVILVSIVLLYKNEFSFIDPKFIRAVILLCIIGTILTMLGYIFPYVGRVGIYAMIFEIVLFSVICKTKGLNLLIGYFVFLLGIYLFINDLLISGQGQMPYKLFYQ